MLTALGAANRAQAGLKTMRCFKSRAKARGPLPWALRARLAPSLLLLACAALPAASAQDGTPSPAALPAVADLREEFLRLGLQPRRQGSRNTCSVFVTADALSFALARHTVPAGGRGRPLSVEYLNWACNEAIGNGADDRGQFFHDLLRAFASRGVCYEDEMPYAERFDPQLQPSAAARASAAEIQQQNFKIHWIKRWRRYESGLSAAQLLEVKSALADGWPVAAGADHSRLLVGYRDDAAQPGGGVFIARDSGTGRDETVTYEFARTQVNDAYWAEVLSDAAQDASKP